MPAAPPLPRPHAAPEQLSRSDLAPTWAVEDETPNTPLYSLHHKTTQVNTPQVNTSTSRELDTYQYESIYFSRDEEDERLLSIQPEQLKTEDIIAAFSSIERHAYGESIRLCYEGLKYELNTVRCNKRRYCTFCRNLYTSRKRRDYQSELAVGEWYTTILELPGPCDSLHATKDAILDLFGRFKKGLNKLTRHEPKGFALLWSIEAVFKARWNVHVHLMFRSSKALRDQLHPLWESLVQAQMWRPAVELCRKPSSVASYMLKSDALTGGVPLERLPEYIEATEGVRLCGTLGALRGTGRPKQKRREQRAPNKPHGTSREASPAYTARLIPRHHRPKRPNIHKSSTLVARPYRLANRLIRNYYESCGSTACPYTCHSPYVVFLAYFQRQRAPPCSEQCHMKQVTSSNCMKHEHPNANDWSTQ